MPLETAGLSCGESDEPLTVAPSPADAGIKKAALHQYANQESTPASITRAAGVVSFGEPLN